MKTRISVIGATLAILFAGGAFATSHADGSSSMTVDSVEPIRVTLLPTVSIDATPSTSAANPARMRVADTAPITVTLLPTVHVKARANPELAVTLLPTIRVVATDEDSSIGNDRVAEAEDATPEAPLVDDTSAWSVEQPIGLHHRAVPR
jgi:hypothetical protein